MLTINDAVKDYDAVMTSTKYLQNLWGSKWPEGHTLEQNIIDLGWHQYEFQIRRSFAYSIVPNDESRILGTIYINPTRKKGYDAAVHYWVRQSEVKTGFEEKVLIALSISFGRSRYSSISSLINSFSISVISAKILPFY